MAKDKIDLHRAFYPLDEAAEMADLKVADLFGMAANGKLHISVIADEWKAASVYEIDHSIHTADSGLVISFKGPALPEFPDPDDEDFIEKVEQWQRTDDSRDLVVGNQIHYAKRGPFRVFFKNSITGPKPVAVSSLARYLISPDNAKIELDLNQILGVSDAVHERFIQLDPEVLVQTALHDQKLVVLRNELGELLGQTDEQLIATWTDDPRWPEELGLAISAWRHARDDVKEGEEPGVYIRKWLKPRKISGKSLSNAAVERIATIANWDKSPGAPKKGLG